MISAAIAAPALGGRVVFSIDTRGALLDAITPSQVTIYIAALEPLPANTLRQRQKAQILAWLSEHDDNTDTSSACTAITQTRELALTTTDLGKPYWPNSPWLLNWSHSRHYLALAIAPRELLDGASNNDNSLANTPENVAGVLGIDIELLGRARAREALAAHYYHPNEHALATSELGFLTIWTRKEAIVKAHGIGLRISLKSLNTATDIVDHSQLGRWQCNSFSLQEHSHEIAVLSLSWPATRKP